MTPFHIQVSKSIHQHQTSTSLRFRIQEVNWINKLNLDRRFQKTFPIQNYITQFSLNYIYRPTHGDILEWLNKSNADFKVLSLRSLQLSMVRIFCSAGSYIGLLLLLTLLEQRKFTVCWTSAYPGSTPAHHHTSAIITDCNRSTTLSPRGLTFPDFDLAPKRNEKFGYCGLDLV